MTKKFSQIRWVTLGICLSVALSAPAMAAEKATREECIAKCREAAQVVRKIGLPATLKQMNDINGPFVWKDSYVFCYDFNCVIRALPTLPHTVGRDIKAVRDANGKMFPLEFVHVAKTRGEGWVTYMWPKPGEKTPSEKTTYVYALPEHKVLFAAGIYKNTGEKPLPSGMGI